MNQEIPRLIVCAAVRYPNGTTLVGPRHYDKVMLDQYQRAKLTDEEDRAEQGFLDQFGVFLTRTEAWPIAEAAGQIRRRVGGDTRMGGALFSENLY